MWYYHDKGKQQGPLEETALREQYAQGKLSADTLVWKQDTPDWISIRQAFPDIQPHLTTEEHALSWVAPVFTSWLAIIAGYLGLFSILLFPAAPLALLFGILALRDLKKNPDKAGWGRAIFGIVMGGGICGLLLFFFLFCLFAG